MERCQLLLGLQAQDYSVPGMCQAKDTGWHSCPSREVGIFIPLQQATGFREGNFVSSHTVGGQIRVLSWNCFLGLSMLIFPYWPVLMKIQKLTNVGKDGV